MDVAGSNLNSGELVAFDFLILSLQKFIESWTLDLILRKNQLNLWDKTPSKSTREDKISIHKESYFNITFQKRKLFQHL